MKKSKTLKSAHDPIQVYLESSMVLNRKTWSWHLVTNHRVELLGYESAQEALDGLTQANLVMNGRYVSCARPVMPDEVARIQKADAQNNLLLHARLALGWIERVSDEVTMGPDDRNVLKGLRAAINDAMREAR